MAVCGHRRFWRVPGFDGQSQEPLDWKAAARASIAHLLGAAKDETRAYEGDLPRWIWSSFEDTPSGTRSQLAYPAQHLPSFITCFLLFAATEPADPLAGQAIAQAIRCGDWLLDHRLPADWACDGLPLSTIEQGELRGGLEGQAITLFRSARVGEAMLELADATGDERYARYAGQIADRLWQTQRGDGSWPHRIDPETGRVVSTYSSSAITPVLLFASLAERGLGAYEQPRLAAERWLEDNPLRTGRWEGMYEDIPAGGEAFTNLQHRDVNECALRRTAAAVRLAGVQRRCHDGPAAVGRLSRRVSTWSACSAWQGRNLSGDLTAERQGDTVSEITFHMVRAGLEQQRARQRKR